jgi:hypothetical protein
VIGISGFEMDRRDRFAKMLGQAAMNGCGDMPRDTYEALFKKAMTASARNSRVRCTTVLLYPAKPD